MKKAVGPDCARHPSRQIFEPEFNIKCKAFDRLVKYVHARRKRRYLNFIATQYTMLKYKRIALKHWQLLYKHQEMRKQRLGATFQNLYRKKLAEGLATLNRFYGR